MYRNTVFSLLFLIFVSCHSSNPKTAINDPAARTTKAPFDRHSLVILTRHARCRMDCRHITIKEIHEILDSGTVNYEKSEPEARPDPKYAIEGYTAELQHLRIIVAPEAGKLIIITCIELGVEWNCHCN